MRERSLASVSVKRLNHPAGGIVKTPREFGYQRAVEVVGEPFDSAQDRQDKQGDEGGAMGDSEDALEAGNGQEKTEMEGVEGDLEEE